jgi:hypothetical protein
MDAGQQHAEMGARRFALAVGRALALALLVEHAQWALDHEGDARPRAAAMRFAWPDRLNMGDAFLLANDG